MGLGNFFRNIADRVRRSPTDFRNTVRQEPYEIDEPFTQPAKVDSGKFGLKGRLKNIGNTFGFNRLTRTGKTNELYTAGISQNVNSLRNFTALDDGLVRTRITIRNPQTGITETKTLDLTRTQARQFENNPQAFAESNLSDLSRYVGEGFEVVSFGNEQ